MSLKSLSQSIHYTIKLLEDLVYFTTRISYKGFQIYFQKKADLCMEILKKIQESIQNYNKSQENTIVDNSIVYSDTFTNMKEIGDQLIGKLLSLYLQMFTIDPKQNKNKNKKTPSPYNIELKQVENNIEQYLKQFAQLFEKIQVENEQLQELYIYYDTKETLKFSKAVFEQYELKFRKELLQQIIETCQTNIDF